MNSFKKIFPPYILLTILTLFFISPILKDITNLGLSDWDSHFFYNAVPVKTILEYGEFPLWNPYYCGGNVMLASPESTFLAPPFLIALLFKEVVGIKLIIVLYTLLGMIGMHFLSRVLNFGIISSYIAPLIFVFSSWYPLRITEGHTTFFPFMILPFIVGLFIKAIDSKLPTKQLILCTLLFTWILFGGGVYPLILSGFFLLLFSIAETIKRRSFRPALYLCWIVVMTFFLGAIKVIPSYEFTSQFPRKSEAKQFHSIEILKKSLFSRNQKVTTQDAIFYGEESENNKTSDKFWSGEKPWGWHEYGAFIGVTVFIIYLSSFIFIKQIWNWLSFSLILLLLSLGDFAPINLWGALRTLPIFNFLHGPSRITPIFIFTVAIICGFTVSRVEKNDRIKKINSYAAIAILITIFFELVTVTRPVLHDAFTEPFPEIKKENRLRHFLVNDPTKSGYPLFLNNIGVLNCYESVHPPIKAIPYGDENGRVNPDYKGEVYLLSGKSAEITYFSPNKIEVSVDSDVNDRIVLNQNYYKGWKAYEIDGNILAGKVESYDGLISLPLTLGKSKIIFYFSPLSYKIGLTLSSVSFILCLLFLIRSFVLVKSSCR